LPFESIKAEQSAGRKKQMLPSQGIQFLALAERREWKWRWNRIRSIGARHFALFFCLPFEFALSCLIGSDCQHSKASVPVLFVLAI